MSDALIVIAEKNYQDIELKDILKALKEHEFSSTIASKTAGMKTGVLGSKVEAEISLKEVDLNEYNAIVFIGGSGSQEYFEDEEALNLVKEFHRQKKIVAAICITPMILAHAGILKGKKATIWDDGRGSFIYRLEQKGAEYTGKDVQVDGNIITANGPDAAVLFGEEIAMALGKI